MQPLDLYKGYLDGKEITVSQIKEFCGFLYFPDCLSFIDKILRSSNSFEVASMSQSLIKLNPERVNSIILGLRDWQDNEEMRILRKHSPRSGRRISGRAAKTKAVIPNIEIPYGYISVSDAIKKYGRSRVLTSMLNNRGGRTYTVIKIFGGKNYLLESQFTLNQKAYGKKPGIK